MAGLFNTLTDLGISFSYNQNKGLVEFLGGKVLCRSMENFNVLRGIEIGSFWLDEARDMKREAFEMLLGRLRCKSVNLLQGRITSTSKGFDWMYDYFHPNGENNTADFEMIRMGTADNPHLPDGYLDTLRSQYSDNFYRQEVLGEFLNVTTGKVYGSFDRKNHVKNLERTHYSSIYCGLDFNVDPMSCVICEYYDGVFHIIDEIFMRDSTTPEMAKEIKRRYGRGCQIIPDSTAKNRKTSGKSDLDMLRNEGFEIMNTRNPYVMDRVNNVNRLLEQGRIKISPKCVKLINDLEKVTWKEGDIKLDQKTDKLLTHISDALGYLCWKLEPIVSGSRGVTIVKR